MNKQYNQRLLWKTTLDSLGHLRVNHHFRFEHVFAIYERPHFYLLLHHDWTIHNAKILTSLVVQNVPNLDVLAPLNCKRHVATTWWHRSSTNDWPQTHAFSWCSTDVSHGIEWHRSMTPQRTEQTIVPRVIHKINDLHARNNDNCTQRGTINE